MRVYIQVQVGDREAEVTLTPETQDVLGDDAMRTIGPTPREVIERATRMILSALESE
jgi:hypothetical protein